MNIMNGNVKWDNQNTMMILENKTYFIHLLHFICYNIISFESA